MLLYLSVAFGYKMMNKKRMSTMNLNYNTLSLQNIASCVCNKTNDTTKQATLVHTRALLIYNQLFLFESSMTQDHQVRLAWTRYRTNISHLSIMHVKCAPVCELYWTTSDNIRKQGRFSKMYLFAIVLHINQSCSAVFLYETNN